LVTKVVLVGSDITRVPGIYAYAERTIVVPVPWDPGHVHLHLLISGAITLDGLEQAITIVRGLHVPGWWDAGDPAPALLDEIRHIVHTPDRAHVVWFHLDGVQCAMGLMGCCSQLRSHRDAVARAEIPLLMRAMAALAKMAASGVDG